MDHQSNILRKTPGINNLFHSNVRRSRSAASLQKALPEEFRSQSSLGARPYNDTPQTGLRPPLKTAKTVVSPDGLIQPTRKWFANSSVTATPKISRTPSPPSRPKPAPRLWNEEDDELDIKPSLLGLETFKVPRSQYNPNPQYNQNLPQRKPVAAGSSQYYFESRTHPALTTSSPPPSHDTSVSRRRKPSVADLHLDTLSTVTEWSNDSPTFRLGRNNRNHSDPTNGNRESITPRAMLTDHRANMPHPESATAVTPTAHKRASSMLLPISLAPIITSSPPQIDTYPKIRSPEGDKPPVPPKSPRYKTGPNSRQPPVKKRSASSSGSNSSMGHSANSSFSELNFTIPSTATTMSPVELPCGWPEKDTLSPPLSPKSVHNSVIFLDQSRDPSGALPWVMKEFQPTQMRPQPSPRPPHDRSMSDVGSPPVEKPQSPHQRSPSDSVLNRGRPTKRSQHKNQRSMSRELKLGSISATLDELPEGHRLTQAFDAYTNDQLMDMRFDAERTARSFEALRQQDVRNLKKELDLLGDLCADLRRKTVSLRDSRRQLHDRLIAYLRAPGNALVSREHVVKQDSELAELDSTIDDATTKLEAAQERRNKVQRKLLEHTAAVLAISVPACGTCEKAPQPTPPRSPAGNASLDIVISLSPSEAEAVPAESYQSSPESYEGYMSATNSGPAPAAYEQFTPAPQQEHSYDSYGTASQENYDGSGYGSYEDSAPSSFSAGAIIDAHAELDKNKTRDDDGDVPDQAQLEREEREYEGRMQLERDAADARENEIQAQAEQQHAALEREVHRQQQQRDDQAAADAAAVIAAKQAEAEAASDAAASAAAAAEAEGEDLPLMLSQERYEPPAMQRSASAQAQPTSMQRNISQQSQLQQPPQSARPAVMTPPRQSSRSNLAPPPPPPSSKPSKASPPSSKASTPLLKGSSPPSSSKPFAASRKLAAPLPQLKIPSVAATAVAKADKVRQLKEVVEKRGPAEEKQHHDQPAPRGELVQSIQVYADEGVYGAEKPAFDMAAAYGGVPRDGMESLLSSIEQEIDAMDRQRSTSVFA